MAVYRVILFDLDGTLTDPKIGITKSLQYALQKLGIDSPSPDALTAFIGPPLHVTFSQQYHLDSHAVSQAVSYYREYFSSYGLYENHVYEGIPSLLEALRVTSRHLVVATSKPSIFAERILDYFGLRAFFDTVIGSNLDGSRSGKTEIIAQALQCYPGMSDAVMIGDRAHDIVGAHNNGIDSVAVTYGYGSLSELREANPTFLAHTVKETERLLAQ
ncbi:phosphoglycolate phosphatase [Sulfobacillus sp. hq2]|nr:HAD family hydrolase [Sulfobacillus sp. hq2]POB11262.1 phosphoglycolate phosphatase [Sulfobacillus sp. hq2]